MDLSNMSAAELVSRLSNNPGDMDAVVRELSAREHQHRAALAEIGALRKNSQRIQEELEDHLTAALSDIDEVYEEQKERLGKIAAETRAKITASFSKVRVQEQQQQDEEYEAAEQQRRQKVFREEALDIMWELDRHFGARLRPYRAQMAQIVNHFINPPPVVTMPAPLPHASTEDLRRWLSAQPSPVQQAVVMDKELMRDVGSFLQERLRRQMDEFDSRYTNGTRSADGASRGTS